MGFENTRIGMKFFNRDIPELINSINRVGDSLNALSQPQKSEKEKHYHDLLNSIINHVSNCENNSTTIKTLLYWGFTIEDLVQDFNFDETEVKDCSEDMDNFDPVYQEVSMTICMTNGGIYSDVIMINDTEEHRAMNRRTDVSFKIIEQ